MLEARVFRDNQLCELNSKSNKKNHKLLKRLFLVNV